MTRLAQRRPENVTGDLFVDDTCIDCDTCRWMAPDIFERAGDQSAVFHQPISDDERLRAMQALLACPTHSIATVEKPKDIQQAQRSLPIPITDAVFHCGYHSEDSFGAASYFIQRPEGNVLVDSPRFAAPLVKRLEKLGGVKYMYLTHRDDVADHAKFQQHFGCDRILHSDDITTDTREVERPISGNEPYKLADDLEIIPVPGHSRGHTVLLYDNRVLFTGDHLAWSVRLNQLYAFRAYCWYSWPMQIESMKQLLNYSFEWVLPGHGRRFNADKETMRRRLEQCIDWMQQQGA